MRQPNEVSRLRRQAPLGLTFLILVTLVTASVWADSDPVAETTTASEAVNEYPSVHFHYSFVPFDRACSKLSEDTIEEAWIAELEKRLPSFQAYWDREGPRLLAAALAEVGKPFRRREVSATLSLCKFPSMSHPLLVNMRRFMDSATDGEPRPMFLFGALVFHELLHTYVFDNLEASELIDKKYDAEPGSVKSHVHLMAIMKKTYLKLGLEEELARITEKDSKIGPIYARAWEIVSLEGHEALLSELRE